MDNQAQKPFSAKRWTENPIPRVIGKVEFTEEEKVKHDLQAEEALRFYGRLKPNEHIRDGKIIRE